MQNFKIPMELMGQITGLVDQTMAQTLNKTMAQTLDKTKEMTKKKWHTARFITWDQMVFFIENNDFSSAQVFFYEGSLCLLYC